MSHQTDATIATEVTDPVIADADVARGKAFDGSSEAITLLITLEPVTPAFDGRLQTRIDRLTEGTP
jgi:hypothetical protein